MHNEVEDGDKPHADVRKIDGKGLLRRRRRRSSIPSCCCRLSSEFSRRKPLREIFVEIQMNLEESDTMYIGRVLAAWENSRNLGTTFFTIIVAILVIRQKCTRLMKVGCELVLRSPTVYNGSQFHEVV